MKKPALFFLLICLSIACFSATLGRLNNFPDYDDEKVSVVVIDPGHGGKDLGAIVGNSQEKDLTLAISLKLGAKIKSVFPGIKVIYTRTNDEFIPVYERAEIANKNKADLFISIHANSVNQTYVKGAETYVLGQHLSNENLEVAKKENAVILLEDDYNTTYEGFNPGLPESYIMFELVQDEYLEQSVLLASHIQDQFRETANLTDRSVRQADFIVLRKTTMPGVLIETGFISNAKEREYMFSEVGQNELSNAIFKAFSTYKKIVEDKSKFALVTRTENQEEAITTPVQDLKSKNELTTKKNITYSVQLSSSTKKLKPTSANFRRIKNVFSKKFGDTYKYFSGSYESYEDALSEKQLITKKFPDAFVVAFENDELISVKMVPED